MATETNEWINKWLSYWFLCNFFWAFRLILWIKDPAKLSTENASLLIACLVCSRARRACVLVCLHVHMLNMPASLRAWRAFFLTCLTCSRLYVFTCLACLLVFCPYVLTCLTCLLCSNTLRAYVLVYFFDIVCHIFFTLENSKNSYIEKFIYCSEEYLETTWTTLKEFFRKKINV